MRAPVVRTSGPAPFARRAVATAACLAAAALGAATPAAASTNVPFAGAWRAGINVNNSFKYQWWSITAFDPASGAFSGTGTDATSGAGVLVSGTITGDYTLSQARLAATVTYPATPGRQTTVKLLFGTNALSAIGGPAYNLYPGSGFQDGTLGPGFFPGNITRVHPTGSRVSCNRGPNPTDDFQCTAEVGDGAPELPTSPTGTVTFTSSSGTFRSGNTCVLSPTPGSGSVSSCTVTWIPPAGGLEAGNQPDVVASYPGDPGHGPSTGTTQPKIALGFLVPLTPTPAACDRAAADAQRIASRGGAAVGGASPGARAALNTFTQPQAEKEWGAWVYYNAATCKNVAGTGLGYLLQGVGVGTPVVYNAALLFDVEPVTRVMGTTWGNNVVIIPTSYVVFKSGQSMVETADKSQKDPPDPRFKTYAKVRRTPRITIRPGGGLSRAGAAAVGRMLTAQLAADATAKALGATIDKAGGALKARNRTWQGRQVRRALRYAKTFVGQLSALPGLRAAAARAAGSAPQFSRAPSMAAIRRAQGKLRRGGLPRGLVARLRILGFSAAELRALRTAAIGAKPAGDLRPARLLTDPAVSNSYRILAAYFRIWSSSPQVIAASKLR
ncbi:MAG: hypothetical protein U0R70_15790 [Solirubrobacteraceae bacterium]